MNLLNLSNFVVLNVAENEDDYCVTVETASPSSCCPHCGVVLSDNLMTRFGRKAQIFMDLPMHAKRVGVKVVSQRYRCNQCMTTFFEVLPDIDDKRMATKRLVAYIEKESLCRPFTSIAHDVGVNEKTVRNIFRDYVNRLEKTIRFETPTWLGIDEIHIIKPRCVITNIKERTIVNLLPTRDKEALCSDYFPPALLHAVFKLNTEYNIPLWDAVKMVTLNPAKALGIENDFGAVTVGRKADLILIKILDSKPAIMKVFIIDGKMVSGLYYRNGNGGS
ncbi:MAG TPA: amidohydrolase family protein [Spirochaetia bacterium]|nr:amidohydrolase family protein [Spirochaetia bacterium]